MSGDERNEFHAARYPRSATGGSRDRQHARNLWSSDGSRVLWCNPVGVRVLALLTQRNSRPKSSVQADPLRRQVAQLCNAIARKGAARLERMRGGASLDNCRPAPARAYRLRMAKMAVLVAAADPVARPMPLRTDWRVASTASHHPRRLYAGWCARRRQRCGKKISAYLDHLSGDQLGAAFTMARGETRERFRQRHASSYRRRSRYMVLVALLDGSNFPSECPTASYGRSRGY